MKPLHTFFALRRELSNFVVIFGLPPLCLPEFNRAKSLST
nr:MAG TPA: hypothetical protein [Caudoviricetes sp.]